MASEKDLEDFVRLAPAGGHSDIRRTITDVPAGYLYGRNIAVANIIQVSEQSTGLPLGQHFHLTYGEVFAVVHGKGDFLVRAVAPGERNLIKDKLVVPENLGSYAGVEERLYGIETKLTVDSRDPKKMLLRVTPGLAHTFILEPGSVLIPFLFDAPKDFNPKNPANYVAFPLI